MQNSSATFHGEFRFRKCNSSARHLRLLYGTHSSTRHCRHFFVRGDINCNFLQAAHQWRWFFVLQRLPPDQLHPSSNHPRAGPWILCLHKETFIKVTNLVNSGDREPLERHLRSRDWQLKTTTATRVDESRPRIINFWGGHFRWLVLAIISWHRWGRK